MKSDTNRLNSLKLFTLNYDPEESKLEGLKRPKCPLQTDSDGSEANYNSK